MLTQYALGMVPYTGTNTDFRDITTATSGGAAVSLVSQPLFSTDPGRLRPGRVRVWLHRLLQFHPLAAGSGFVDKIGQSLTTSLWPTPFQRDDHDKTDHVLGGFWKLPSSLAISIFRPSERHACRLAPLTAQRASSPSVALCGLLCVFCNWDGSPELCSIIRAITRVRDTAVPSLPIFSVSLHHRRRLRVVRAEWSCLPSQTP